MAYLVKDEGRGKRASNLLSGSLPHDNENKAPSLLTLSTTTIQREPPSPSIDGLVLYIWLCLRPEFIRSPMFGFTTLPSSRTLTMVLRLLVDLRDITLRRRYVARCSQNCSVECHTTLFSGTSHDSKTRIIPSRILIMVVSLAPTTAPNREIILLDERANRNGLSRTRGFRVDIRLYIFIFTSFLPNFFNW